MPTPTLIVTDERLADIFAEYELPHVYEYGPDEAEILAELTLEEAAIDFHASLARMSRTRPSVAISDEFDVCTVLPGGSEGWV